MVPEADDTRWFARKVEEPKDNTFKQYKKILKNEKRVKKT